VVLEWFFLLVPFAAMILCMAVVVFGLVRLLRFLDRW